MSTSAHSDHALLSTTADAVPAETACPRCVRLGIACIWKACQRTGRPRKRPFREGEDTLEQLTPALGGIEIEHRLNSDVNRVTASAEDAHTMYPFDMDMLSLMGAMGTDLSRSDDGQSGFLDQMFDQIMFVPKQTSEQRSGDADRLAPRVAHVGPATVGESPPQDGGVRSAAPIQIAQMRKRIRRRAESPARGDQVACSPTLSSTNSLLTSYGSCAETGVSRYFSGVGLALPLYTDRPDFHARLHDCEEAQVYAAAALGHALYDGVQSAPYQSARQSSIDAVERQHFHDGLHHDNSVRVAAHIAALILVAYADYAEEDSVALERHLTMARTAALQIALHRMDDSSSSALSHSLATHARVEAARQTWWELWVLDCIIDVTSSGTVGRRFRSVQTRVNFPGEYEGSTRRRLWSIRIRSVSLLADAVSSASFTRNAERVRAADVMQANVMAEAQQMYLATARARKDPSTRRDGEELKCAQVVLFDCLIMLHAGRIHLHRLYWFADLTLDLDSCSFRRPAVRYEEGATRLHEEETRQALGARDPYEADGIASSVDKIVGSADAILHLMQLDTDAFFNRAMDDVAQRSSSSTASIIAPHWPPIGCCYMVASYGLVVGIAAGVPDQTNDGAAERPESDISIVAPGAASGRDACAVQPERALWRAEQSVSSIGMAEASLGVISEVWPVAAAYRKQVHLCRLAVDSNLAPYIPETLADG